MSDTLYLHQRSVAGGTLDLTSRESTTSFLTPYKNKRVAALVCSKDASYVVVSELSNPSPSITTPLSIETKGDTKANGNHEPVSCRATWSPDGRVLLVHGGDALWVLTHRNWIDDAVTTTENSSATAIQIDVRAQIAQDAQWRRAKASSVSIVAAFFHAKAANRCFLLTRDAWLLKMEIQTAELLVQARSGEALTPSFFRIQSVMRLSTWHGDISAVAFDSTTATLVISGGLKNPSHELRTQRASSLSVWSVRSDDPFVELLDTAIVAGAADSDQNGTSAIPQSEDPSQTTLMKSAKRSLLNPLKLLQGGGGDNDAVVIPGTIHHLAISSDGVFLSIVDKNGRFRLRQIDVCADVSPWELVDDYAPAPVAEISWLGPSMLAFHLQDHSVSFGFLAADDSVDPEVNGDAEDGEEDAQPLSAIQVVMQRSMSDASVESNTTHALTTVVVEETEAEIYTLAVTASSGSTEWQLAAQATTTPRELVQRLIASQQFDKALALAEHCREQRERRLAESNWEADDEDMADSGFDIDVDQVYTQLWMQYRSRATVESINGTDVAVVETAAESSFEQALAYLNGVVHSKTWVVSQCLTTIVAASDVHMKELLATGLRAAVAISGDASSVVRTTLLRYLYRLGTLHALLKAECKHDQDPTYDGKAFASFRDAPLVQVAEGLASEGRIAALTVLFRRHAWNLVPHRLQILESLPAMASPRAYAHLLPAVGPRATQEWQLYTLQPIENGDEEPTYDIVPVDLLPENRSHDFCVQEAADFDAYAGQDPEHRRGDYALWFTHRMVELDSMFGHLEHAVVLGRCARTACLHDAASGVEATPLPEFLDHSERFYQCVHELQLPVCQALSLEDWSLLSLHDQVLLLVQFDGQATDSVPDSIVHTTLHRLRVVFLAPRRHPRALDEVISWLCQALLAKHSSHAPHDPLLRLQLCAMLIHESNPASPRDARWIQDDARLLRTALDIVYAANTQELAAHTEKPRHQRFVDHLWLIFQSLPERKPTDREEINQLQVQVDGLEDLLVAMDVLANYDVWTSPGELRERLLTEDQSDAFAIELVDLLAVFALGNQVTWLAVWQDALKLKTHLFGERLHQETVLARLLTHFLTDSSRLHETHDLLANWLSANVDALPTAMDLVAKRVRQLADADELALAAQLVALAQSVLATFEGNDSASHISDKLEAQLTKAQRLAKLQELLMLLSDGQLRVTRSELKELRSERDRVEVVLRLLSSNASNYKLKSDALAWLRSEGLLSADVFVDVAIDGVLCLAKLLRVNSSHGREKIVVRTAYAALYCADFEAAYRLVMRVVDDRPTEAVKAGDVDEEEEENVELLLSLVLELVSASAFRAWERKITLLRLLLAKFAHSDVFWHHALADLLLQKLQTLEATHALARELGLSESELAARREAENQWTSDDQQELLTELELVVELLQEDAKVAEDVGKQRRDTEAVLTLLCKGLALVTHTQSHSQAPMVPSSPSAKRRRASVSSESDGAWMGRVLPQLTVLSVDLALRGDDKDAEATIDLALAYALQLASISTDNEPLLPGVWRDEIYSKLETTEASHKQRVVECFQCLFRWLATGSALPLRQLPYTGASGLRAVAETVDADTSMVEATKSTFSSLADQCAALLHSHQATQELKTVATLLADDSVDLNRFAADADYRVATLQKLPTTKESLAVAKQLARKYEMDEFDCVLAYMRHAFVDTALTTSAQRQQQLERAFRGHSDDSSGHENEFLEQLLQRPRVFATFLLHEVYDALDGTDHVGILLVLRMALECSKRCQGTEGDGSQDASDSPLPLPFSKATSDRLTLLFLCLKRLKEVSETVGSHKVPDFKRVCGAVTTDALLNGEPLEAQPRVHAEAIAALRDFLTPATVKMLTKVLQKLHGMTASAIVMVFVDAALERIWGQHSEPHERSADLAAYAYESCVPFLSVLSLDHLRVLDALFMRGAAQVDPSQFYGQRVESMALYSALLSKEKRLEIAADHAAMVRAKAASVRDGARHVECMEHQVIIEAVWFIADRCGLSDAFESELGAWMASESRAENADRAVNAVVAWCESQRVSLPLSTLLLELALALTTASVEYRQRVVSDLYCKGVSDVIQRVLSDKHSEREGELLVRSWATQWTSPEKSGDDDKRFKATVLLREFLASARGSPMTKSDDAYDFVLNRLASVTSPTLQTVVESRKHQSSGDGVASAIVAQFATVLRQYEEQEKWSVCALLSHALEGSTMASSLTKGERARAFGLRVKAVAEFLAKKHSRQLSVSLSVEQVFDQFSSGVVEAWLAVVEEGGDAACSQAVTVAVASLLCEYIEVKGSFVVGAAGTAWRNEVERALQGRLRGSFSMDEAPGKEETMAGPSAHDALWGSVLVRGYWGDASLLFEWITTVAFDTLPLEAVQSFVDRHLQTSPLATLLLLLTSPFDSIRQENEAFILQTSRAFVLGGSSIGSTNSAVLRTTVLELLLVRFDLLSLRLLEGLESVLLAFFQSTPNQKTRVLTWTSTSEYAVCRLVMVKEYATAGRLVCALWQVHPMLWDVENARLALGNYLRALVTTDKPTATPSMADVRRTRMLAHEHYQQELL